MSTPHTPGKWAWQKFGKYWSLTGQHGMRPIVLSVMKGELTSLVDGRLVPLDPRHPDAELIASAPDLLTQRNDLLEALQALAKNHEADLSCMDLRRLKRDNPEEHERLMRLSDLANNAIAKSQP